MTPEEVRELDRIVAQMSPEGARKVVKIYEELIAKYPRYDIAEFQCWMRLIDVFDRRASEEATPAA